MSIAVLMQNRRFEKNNSSMDAVKINEPRRILVVADDVIECSELRAVFGQLPPQWKVYFSSSEVDAISYLDQVDFDIVFADLSKGPLAGAQFLHEVWARRPSIIRFLLGDSMDPDIMLTCVMASHQFLMKPIEPSSVEAALDRSGVMHELLQDRQLQSLLSRIRTFPARPRIYMEVMREIRSQHASAQMVGELVTKDLGISTKLLQVINSAAFGLSQKVSSPADAVLLLGMQTTAALVLGIEAFAQLDQLNATEFPVEELWAHSQNVAQGARCAAQFFTRDSNIAHDAFTAGLLHDLGKLALAMNFPEEYQFALAVQSEKRLDEHEAEKEVLGATHAEAGAYLLSLWGLPCSIIRAVAGHHQPAPALPPEFSAVTAVHLANVFENSRRAGTPLDEEAIAALGYHPGLGIPENFAALSGAMDFCEEREAESTHLIPVAAGA